LKKAADNTGKWIDNAANGSNNYTYYDHNKHQWVEKNQWSSDHAHEGYLSSFVNGRNDYLSGDKSYREAFNGGGGGIVPEIRPNDNGTSVNNLHLLHSIQRYQ